MRALSFVVDSKARRRGTGRRISPWTIRILYGREQRRDASSSSEGRGLTGRSLAPEGMPFPTRPVIERTAAWPDLR